MKLLMLLLAGSTGRTKVPCPTRVFKNIFAMPSMISNQMLCHRRPSKKNIKKAYDLYKIENALK